MSKRKVPDAKCRRCGSLDRHERFELTEGSGDWCDDGWHDSRERLLAKSRTSEAELAVLRKVRDAAAEMRNWYRKQMGPDGPEVAFDEALEEARKVSGQ